jgi:hypothetical protein
LCGLTGLPSEQVKRAPRRWRHPGETLLTVFEKFTDRAERSLGDVHAEMFRLDVDGFQRGGRRQPRRLAACCLVLLITAACGGNTQTQVQAPRLAVQLPRGPTGPFGSPAVHSALVIQGALDLPTSQSTMRTYLGRRYAGDWIVNNGRRGTLFVGGVHLTRADQAYARNHLHVGPGAGFILLGERYSMTQLDSYQSVVSRYIDNHTKGKELDKHLFVGFGVYPPDNAVELTVSRRDAAYWVPRIQPLIPYDAFVVQYSPIRATTAL